MTIAHGDPVTLPIGLCAQLACIWEVMARKPGNVHRYRDFRDLRCVDFLMSAAAIAPVMEKAGRTPVGRIILDAITATRQVITTNANLGIVLLLAPLAKVSRRKRLERGIGEVLANLTLDDARHCYEAIRLANPGGLGRVPHQDVQDEPTLPLREVMAAAAERDTIARQYANGYREVFTDGVPALLEGFKKTNDLEEAIVLAYLHLLAKYPDTLIVRKQGAEEAAEASRRARRVLETGWPMGAAGVDAFNEFDTWLGAKGNGRNPGTTADLVTACLFVAFREGLIPVK